MLARRLIPCLDVRDGRVVKGVQFRNHVDMGDIIELAQRYRDSGADELVFYDITASSDGRTVSAEWVTRVAKVIDIPFCVAGGIRSLDDARTLLHSGADKGDYFVKQFTGDPTKTRGTRWRTVDWAREAQKLGAGEVVLNCMNQDGERKGYDLAQLKLVRAVL